MGTGASTEELSAPAREELAKLSEAMRKELEKEREEKDAEPEKQAAETEPTKEQQQRAYFEAHKELIEGSLKRAVNEVVRQEPKESEIHVVLCRAIGGGEEMKQFQDEAQESKTEVERLRAEVERLRAELDKKDVENQSELEKLRAEIEKLRSPDKAPPTMKTTRSQSVVEAVAHVEAEARREEAEYRCRFYFLDAVQLRDLEGKTLPFYQELRRTHPQLFVERTVTFMEALQGELVEEYSTGSHRWVKADNPDPDGVQLAAVRKHLLDHPQIRYFWYDAWCMPQGEKTATEKADFKRMLDQVNLLYLGTSVLVLVDLSYPSRFWTQFEVWLGQQQATTGGLRPAQGVEKRATFVTIYNGREETVRMLEAQWAAPTPAEAHAILSQPDVTVTNESDKTLQLEKLLKLQELVLRLNNGGGGAAAAAEGAAKEGEGGALRLVFGIERAVGPKPEGRTWRDEWVDAWMERGKLQGFEFTRPDFEAGGDTSIEQCIQNVKTPIQWQVDNGWAREQAEAYTVISVAIAAPLAAAVRDRSDRYAASTHVVCEALAEQARRLTEAAPPVYWNLTGTFGLATGDPAREALLRPGAAVGLGFVTNGLGAGSVANDDIFADEEGYRAYMNYGGNITYELIDSDVVCFRSAPTDADGYHSLVRGNDTGAHALPPMATVTLEKVEEAGEWEANGKRVRRRLFTVGVTYK